MAGLPTIVVNRHRDAYDVYIGRGTPFGNPYQMADREQAIAAYAGWFHAQVAASPTFRAAVLALRGQRLGCSCKPRSCHGDVIVRWLNRNDV